MGKKENNEHSRVHQPNSKTGDSSHQDKCLISGNADQKVNQDHGNRRNPGPSRAPDNLDKNNLLKSGDIKIIQSFDDVRQMGLFTHDTIKEDDTHSIFNKILDCLAKSDVQPPNTDTPAVVPYNEAKPVTSNQLINKVKTVVCDKTSSTNVGKRKRARSSGSPRKRVRHEGRSSFFYYGKLSDLLFRSRNRGHGSGSDSDSDTSSG